MNMILPKRKQDERLPGVLRKYRIGLGMSQTEVGRIFGTTHAPVSDWERGKTEIPSGALMWILGNPGLPKFEICDKCNGTGLTVPDERKIKEEPDG